VKPFRHILVPTDFGECAEQALEIAIGLATKLDAKLTLLHVCELPVSAYAMYAQGLYFPMDELEAAAKKALEEATAKLLTRMPNAESILASGTAVEQILSARKERNADLIVMGTHGRRGLSRVLLGSVAEKTVRLCPVPVLTVPAHQEPAAVSARSEKHA
jgi:nucleotide-binding universal stress UspA family protein